jgi:hypothetical protein
MIQALGRSGKMNLISTRRLLLIVGAVCFFVTASLSDLHAVPSFKRQTGMDCAVCHTVFPELTQAGRDFKLNGYTFSNSTKPLLERLPISAAVQFSYTEQRGLENRVAPFDDNPMAKFNLPQEASLLYAGQISGRFGAFSHVTYSGVDNTLALDHTDIRYANATTALNAPLVYGTTINNNPTVTDLWLGTPAWGFPFASSAVAVTPAAGTVIDGKLALQVGGIGLYTFWNNLLYLEVDAFGSTRRGIARPLGAGTTVDTAVSGVVPYWRAALQRQWERHSLEVGAYGLVADIYPSGLAAGTTDRFIDYAFDAQYQLVYDKHLLAAHATWIGEQQNWDASYSLGNTANSSNRLQTFKGDFTYHYRADFGTVGGALAYFSTVGTTDAVLYAPEAVTGSNTGDPDSSGFILEANYLPKDNLKLVAQYVIYNKFNGGSTNYDGFGRNASDNNTFYLLVWMAF